MGVQNRRRGVRDLPTVYSGSADGRLYALDARSGETLWRYETGGGGSVASPPTVAEGMVYFGSDDYHVYAVSAETGGLIWRFKADGNVHSAPAVWNGMAYFNSNKTLYALNAATPETTPAPEPTPAPVNAPADERFQRTSRHCQAVMRAVLWLIEWTYPDEACGFGAP